MMVRMADVQAAEEQLDAALEALRTYSRSPADWSAHERLDASDRRQLVLHSAHFEKLELLRQNVAGAEARLRGAQAQFAGAPMPDSRQAF